MYSSKSYKTGPGEPHVDNKPKQPSRRIHSGVKKGKTLYGKETRLSKQEPRLSKMEGDEEMCNHLGDLCWEKDRCDACRDFENECGHIYDGPAGGPACATYQLANANQVAAQAANRMEEITKAVGNTNSIQEITKAVGNTSYGPGYQLPGDLSIVAGPTAIEKNAMMLNDRATFQRFLDNDPDFVRKNYKNYMSLSDEINSTNAKTQYSCSYDPENRLTTPIVRGDFSGKRSITDTAIHMINCSRDRVVRMQVQADKSIGEVAFPTGTENHPNTINAVVRTKREKCKLRNMISAMAFDDLFVMFDTYGINQRDAINILKPKMNVVKLENNLGYNVEYSRDIRAQDTPNLCSLKEDMDYIASKQPIAMGSPPLTGGEVNHWKRRAIYKSECENNPMHIMKHAEACFGAGMQLIASGVGIPKGMQAYPSPHNAQPRAMVQSVMAAKDPATMESTSNKAFTTCGPSVCPPCATTDAAQRIAAQAAARASSLTNDVLATSKLFDLVSFLEQPNQSSAPVIFGDPDYNADRGEEANYRTMSFPKSLFRTQQIECASDHLKGLDFPDIHANIISNQFKTYGKMKFFGHKVLGWDYNMDAPNPGNACNRGEHVITATTDQVSSIKLRYVRRFFYVYYGLLIKEIGSVKSELLKNAMRYKTSVLNRQSANTAEEIFELDASIADAERFAPIAETFFGYAVHYHLTNLALLNSRLIDMGGAGVDNKLFEVIVAQRESYLEEVDKQGESAESLMEAARRGQQPDYAIGVGGDGGGGGELPSVGGALNAFPSPPSEAETQQFKTLAKAVIVTLIRDQSPPQMLFEMAFGMDYVSTRQEIGQELGIDWNHSTKWSVIIQAFMNSWDAEGAGRDQPSTTWIKNQIMTWSGYILRHMAEDEEWIISKMGELLTGKYSNSEGVIMASQFLTILGKSVGLTRAQAVQDVQEASGIVTDLEGNTAALHSQIARLQAQKQELMDREFETAAETALALVAAGGAAGETDGTLQQISTSWTNFMTSVGGDIPEPPFEDGGISSEIDYVKTKLVEKHDEMDRLDELVTTMEADLVTARANLVTAQSNVTRIDADLVTANADLVTANADLATANASVGSSNIIITDLIDNPDCSVAEANARDLLSGQITALEGTIETQSETLKTRLDKINELEAGTVEVGDVAADAAAATTETDIYKDKLKKAKETSEAAIKQKNMIIIGLAVFILILIIVVVVK